MAAHSSVLAWRIPGMGAWWAAVHGVTQSQTRLKRLSSSSVAGEQCCDSFRWIAKWLSYTYTWVHSLPNSPPIQAAIWHWAESPAHLHIPSLGLFTVLKCKIDQIPSPSHRWHCPLFPLSPVPLWPHRTLQIHVHTGALVLAVCFTGAVTPQVTTWLVPLPPWSSDPTVAFSAELAPTTPLLWVPDSFLGLFPPQYSSLWDTFCTLAVCLLIAICMSPQQIALWGQGFCSSNSLLPPWFATASGSHNIC